MRLLFPRPLLPRPHTLRLPSLRLPWLSLPTLRLCLPRPLNLGPHTLALKILLTAALLAPALQAEPLTEPCHVDNLPTAVECGSVTVPLDYERPEGHTLDIGFVLLPGFNASSDDPPLFFLAGGPGQAASSLAARVNYMFSEARSDRDIVLLDQRGTGRSAELVCDAQEEQVLAPSRDLVDTQVLSECIALLPDGVEHFTTASAIRDFERVREYLGYPVIDLYGGSYGSRAALAYLALAGDSVRAVVLDGVSPPSVPIGLFGRSAAAAFELALNRCYSVTECKAAYPDLRARFTAVKRRLRAGPVEATIPHPVTGKPTEFRLWQGQFLSLLRLSLYDPQSTALLPALISEAAAGNFLPLAALAVSAGDNGEINPMLNLNIICSEDYPRFSQPAIAADADNSFDGDTSYRVWNTACALMPRFEVDLSWMDAKDFPQPALLLSGAADPVTPPSNGRQAARLFRRARHVIAPEAAHIVAGSDCGGQLIADFLDNPEPDSLDTGCLDDLPGQRFRLDTLGSLSPAAEGVPP